jgi:hypothetical protein
MRSGILIDYLIRYSRACRNYSDFLTGPSCWRKNYSNRGYVVPRLRSSLHKLYRYSRHHELIDRYGMSNKWETRTPKKNRATAGALLPFGTQTSHSGQSIRDDDYTDITCEGKTSILAQLIISCSYRRFFVLIVHGVHIFRNKSNCLSILSLL